MKHNVGYHQSSRSRRPKICGSSSAESEEPSQNSAPWRGFLILFMSALLFLAAGCGEDIATESIDTESLTSEDLPGLLPDADTAGSVLGVTIDQIDERSDLGPAFEHTDIEDLKGAYVGSYRVADDPDGQNVPTAAPQSSSLSTRHLTRQQLPWRLS